MEWWRILGWPTAEEWQAVWALGSVVVATLGLTFAGFQLRQSAKAAARAAKAEEAATRPYVTVRFDLTVDASANPQKAHADEPMLFVVIESIGRTPAADIALTVSPDFQTSGRGRPNTDGPDAAMTALEWVFSGEKSISMLGPGEQLKYVLDFAREVLGPESGLPTRYEVVAVYSDAEGIAEYSNRFVLDLAPWRYSIMEAEPLAIIARQLRRMNENLEKRQ